MTIVAISCRVQHKVWSGYQYRGREKPGPIRKRSRKSKREGIVIHTPGRLSRSQIHNAILMEEIEHHKKDAKKPFKAIDLPEGTYPELIGLELFERTQARLSVHRTEATRQWKEPEWFLLHAGSIKCSMHVNASKSRNAPIYFCSEDGHSNMVNATKIGTLIWDYTMLLADEIELIERANPPGD
jgi:hypothetical protein